MVTDNLVPIKSRVTLTRSEGVTKKNFTAIFPCLVSGLASCFLESFEGETVRAGDERHKGGA